MVALVAGNKATEKGQATWNKKKNTRERRGQPANFQQNYIGVEEDATNNMALKSTRVGRWSKWRDRRADVERAVHAGKQT